MFFGGKGVEYSPDESKRDTEILSKIYATHESPFYLLDTSKITRRLIYFYEHPCIKLYVINLTRNVKGVVHSKTKRSQPLVSSYFGWLKHNIIRQLVVRKLLPERSIHVSYETLCSHTNQVFSALQEWLSIKLDVISKLLPLEPDNHMWSGNLVRYDTIEDVRESQAWKKQPGLHRYLPNFGIGCRFMSR